MTYSFRGSVHHHHRGNHGSDGATAVVERPIPCNRKSNDTLDLILSIEILKVGPYGGTLLQKRPYPHQSSHTS